MRLCSVIEAIGTRSVRGDSLKRGGRAAELYRRHAPNAFRLAYLLTGDRAVAEDLVHEAFIKVVGRFQDLRDPASFPAYLRRAVINLANSHLRRVRLERDHLRKEAAPRHVVDQPDLGTREELKTALLELPIRQRTAIVLRYYEDLSERQAADAMGISDGAVKSLVARGMDTLRKDVTREPLRGSSGGNG
jgi:RNA polymerase sigma-70 factor (sigma-E family)